MIAALSAASPFAARSVFASTSYDPHATFEIKVSEVDLRRNKAGRMLTARIYQPSGPGPFPVMLDLHGGAWNNKDRHAEEPMDRALASSGLLVVAIDMTLAPEAPYPACVQDANYAVRWLKANARKWNGDGSKVGIYGSSSGGHVAELLAMRPRDSRYNAIPLADGPTIDATIAHVAMRSPVSNPFARFKNAEDMKREPMINNHKTFFVPWETIHESNPQEILERHEKVTLVPHHAGRARRQRAAGRSGEVRADVQSRRRRRGVPRLRELRTRMGRQTRAADRPRARDGQGIREAPVVVECGFSRTSA
jgi:poly(3-hydroxybutyrate) depolymerase